MAGEMSSTLASMQDLANDLKESPLGKRLSAPGSDKYNTSIQSYFSQQEQALEPATIIIPESAQEVAEIIKLIAKHHNKKSEVPPCFAVRSGGKTPQAGSANIESGLTIDLSALNHVTPATDRKTVKIGPGLRWGQVYEVLDAMNLGISGGRDATVGVGGLTLGGGISFFGPQRGFVCDDVVSFEVVLADGSIITASQTSHPDLWRALKGGSNNFGIVTDFEFKTFELAGEIWGGQNVYPISTAAQHLNAFYNFTKDPDPDLHASVIQSFALYQGSVIINEGLKYTRPVPEPAVFQEFLSIEPVLYTTNRLMGMSAAVTEQAGFNTDGRRQALFTTTFLNDKEMLEYAFSAWNDSVPDVQETVPKAVWSTTFQPLTPAMTQRGENVLGLEVAPPLVVAQIAVSWDEEKDDEFLIGKAEGIFRDVERVAKTKGLDSRFVYLNYAWSSQDPIKGYGEANVEFMRGVSTRYDPQQLFQKGLVGGFKLGMEG